jgi:hypothetical protein
MTEIDDLIAKSEKAMSTQRDEARLLLEISRMDLENRGRVVLLSLGIVGVVVPLLAQSQYLSSPTLLIWASVSLLASAIVGVVAQAFERRFRNTLMTLHARYVSAAFAAAVRNDKSDVQQPRRLQAEITTLNNRRSKVGDWEDVALYLLFVVGVALLIAAIVFTPR